MMYPYQRGWGDSARAAICELWLGDWYNPRCNCNSLASILEHPQSKVHSTRYEPQNQSRDAHRERAPTSPRTRRQHPRTRNRLRPTPTQTHRQHLRPKDGLRRCQQSLPHRHRLDTSRCCRRNTPHPARHRTTLHPPSRPLPVRPAPTLCRARHHHLHA